MAIGSAKPGLTSTIEIPNKLFFRIGEVCKLLGLEPYVLRFWEKEFPSLSPTKGANGRRMYRKKDVEMVVTIKRLLYENGFTIAGARRVLSAGADPKSVPASPPPAPAGGKTVPEPAKPPSEVVEQVKEELRGILTILNRRC
ncbi:MAG: MerR family transcriptional regulator [Acidobacteriota bacterium]